MKSQKITALDPIRIFYIASEFLPKIFKNAGGDIKKIRKGLVKAINDANKIKDEDLLRYHLDNWHQRYDNYVNSTWELKEVSLKDCGVWPGMGGLPYELTHGDVPDTAKYIKSFLDDKSKLSWKTSRALYIEEMKKFAEIISEYLPLIVLEDGVIRNNKLTPKGIPVIKKCKYDIDDGNHRAVALALIGKKTVKVLVGKRVYKSSLIYK